jgi:hypothetical protein
MDKNRTAQKGLLLFLLVVFFSCEKEAQHITETQTDSILTIYAGTTIGHKDGPVSEAQFQFPTLIASGNDHSLYIVEYTGPFSNLALAGGSRIRKITANGMVTTFYDLHTTNPEENIIRGIAVNKNGVVYISAGNQIKKISADGSQVTVVAGDGTTETMKDGAALSASFWEPRGLAFDNKGVLYIMDTRNNALRLLRKGIVSTLAGGNRDFSPESPVNSDGPKDGTGSQAEFDFPQFLTVDENCNAYVVGGSFAIVRKVTPAGVVSTILKNEFGFDSDLHYTLKGITGVYQGRLYFNFIFHDTAGTEFRFEIQSLSLNGDELTTLVSNTIDIGEDDDNGNGYPNANEDGLNDPNGMVVLANTLYICNTGENRIRQINLSQIK